MRRSLFALSLLAVFPALSGAQQRKLVNCRTLEEAGNFVGPDEVIVDGKVCQQAKPGADAVKPQPPEPLNGATISDTNTDTVVEAAKAAEKRAAARKEKDGTDVPKERSSPVPASAPATENDSNPPVDAVAAPAPVATPSSLTVPPTPSPATEPVPVSAADPAAPPPRPAEVLPPPDPTHPATSSGFYDANAPKRSTNAAPQTNSGFATAEQVDAALQPGATTVPPASSEPQPSTSSEPANKTAPASRAPLDDPDGDHSVKVGDFTQPKEVAPNAAMDRRSSVDPSDADGFQDRQRPECTKNITLGGLLGEKLVLGVPQWADRWIQKNQSFVPEICFSETPMKAARNFLVVFSTPAGLASGKEAAAEVLNSTKDASATAVGTFTTSFGSTWHYSFERNVGTTVLTHDDTDEPHAQPGQLLYATAYTEQGVPVSQRWPGQVKRELKPGEKDPRKLKAQTEVLDRVASDLLSQVVEDIAKL